MDHESTTLKVESSNIIPKNPFLNTTRHEHPHTIPITLDVPLFVISDVLCLVFVFPMPRETSHEVMGPLLFWGDNNNKAIYNKVLSESASMCYVCILTHIDRHEVNRKHPPYRELTHHACNG
jgi:hypothetical protein